MRAHVRKWGNSLALRIPRALAAEAELGDGTAVELSVSDGKLVAAPRRRQRVSLARLLAGIRRTNIHAETDWGPPRGAEVW